VKHCLTSLAAAAVLLFTLSSTAAANCIVPNHGASGAVRLVPPPTLAGQPSTAGGEAAETSSITGFWSTTFFMGNTADIWDEAFELWHDDGTEIALDNAVTPALGNVCLGTWKQTGRTIRLLHYAWNWNPDGTKAGIFQLTATITLDRGGQTFTGTYVSDSFDTGGSVIAELHGEGVIRGRRITVD